MINICIRVLCARHMATSSDQKREGVFVRVFATAMCKIADCSIVSVRCRRKSAKCSAEGMTRRNRSTGRKFRDYLSQAEVRAAEVEDAPYYRAKNCLLVPATPAGSYLASQNSISLIISSSHLSSPTSTFLAPESGRSYL